MGSPAGYHEIDQENEQLEYKCDDPFGCASNADNNLVEGVRRTESESDLYESAGNVRVNRRMMESLTLKII